jgi:hypothetical protein
MKRCKDKYEKARKFFKRRENGKEQPPEAGTRRDRTRETGTTREQTADAETTSGKALQEHAAWEQTR